MKCNNCGHEVKQTMKYCQYCGAQLDNGFDYVPLVEQAKQGDELAFTDLYNYFYPSMLKIAITHTQVNGNSNQSDAEDVLQNAMISAFKNIGSVEDPKAFPGWLSTIVKNRAINYMKPEWKKKTVSLSSLATEDKDGKELEYDPEDEIGTYQPDIILDNQTRQDILKDVMSHLSEEQRIVTVMYFYDEMTMKEIAEELGIEQSTVVGRLQTAKKNIKAEISDIQKKQDLKLYNISAIPFFMWLLGKARTETEKQVANTAVKTMATAATNGAVGKVIEGGTTTVASNTAATTGTIASTTSSNITTATANSVSTATTTSSAINNGIATGSAVTTSSTLASSAVAVTAVGKGLSLATKLIITAAIMVTTAVGIVVVPKVVKNISTEKINLFDGMDIEFSGIDGGGLLTIDYTESTDYKTLAKNKYNSILSTLSVTPSETMNLKNGDKITITIDYNEELANELNLDFVQTTKTITVKGLNEYLKKSSDISEECKQEAQDVAVAYADDVNSAVNGRYGVQSITYEYVGQYLEVSNAYLNNEETDEYNVYGILLEAHTKTDDGEYIYYAGFEFPNIALKDDGTPYQDMEYAMEYVHGDIFQIPNNLYVYMDAFESIEDYKNNRIDKYSENYQGEYSF